MNDHIGKSLATMDEELASEFDKDLGVNPRPVTATPLEQEMARRRVQPTSAKADIIDRTRQEIDSWRRQHETIEAFEKLSSENIEKQFHERQTSRQNDISLYEQRISDLKAQGREDAMDVRTSLQKIASDCAEQKRALTDMIEHADKMVIGLTK